MGNSPSEIKKKTELKLSQLRLKRKEIIDSFRKKVEAVKIEQIRESILNK